MYFINYSFLQLSEEVKASYNNNFECLIGMENRLENKAIHSTEDIKQHTTEQARYSAARVQHSLSETIQNTEENLKSSFKTDVKGVRKGSLIMLTTIKASILRDPEAFEAAVISFLAKIIEDCDINKEIPGLVDARLHILNATEG